MIFCKKCAPIVAKLDESDYFFTDALCTECRDKYNLDLDLGETRLNFELEQDQKERTEFSTKESFNTFLEIQKKVLFSGTKYKIIYADCPWQYENTTGRLAIENHYPTMPLEEIKNLPLEQITDENSILFMWCTWAILPQCLDVIKSWGFKYRSKGFLWVKTNKVGYHFGAGRWTRANSEFCLIATKGHPKRKSARVSELVIAPVKEHSRKPDVVRKKIIQLMGDVPRIELFARTKVDGWHTFGNDEALQAAPLEAFLK